MKLAFRGAPDPNRRRHDWIPTFYVEDDAKRAVFSQDWAKFSGLWRRVGPRSADPRAGSKIPTPSPGTGV